MRPGEPFPSVRSLSTTLKINPNTAHKVIARLTAEGLLEVKPGIGTIVPAAVPENSAGRNNLLKNDLERVVVEAKRAGLKLEDLTAALSYHWTRLSPQQFVSVTRRRRFCRRPRSARDFSFLMASSDTLAGSR